MTNIYLGDDKKIYIEIGGTVKVYDTTKVDKDGLVTKLPPIDLEKLKKEKEISSQANKTMLV